MNCYETTVVGVVTSYWLDDLGFGIWEGDTAFSPESGKGTEHFLQNLGRGQSIFSKIWEGERAFSPESGKGTQHFLQNLGRGKRIFSRIWEGKRAFSPESGKRKEHFLQNLQIDSGAQRATYLIRTRLLFQG
jgi:hypothetical protein